MAYELKTKPNDKNVTAFIESVDLSKDKRKDAYQLLELFEETTGYKAKMWGDSIIGFGSYVYTNISGHVGEWMLVGFSPRKARFSLYLTCEPAEKRDYLKELGKHKTGKACIYVNKLADIDINVLKKLIQQSVAFNQSQSK